MTKSRNLVWYQWCHISPQRRQRIPSPCNSYIKWVIWIFSLSRIWIQIIRPYKKYFSDCLWSHIKSTSVFSSIWNWNIWNGTIYLMPKLTLKNVVLICCWKTPIYRWFSMKPTPTNLVPPYTSSNKLPISNYNPGLWDCVHLIWVIFLWLILYASYKITRPWKCFFVFYSSCELRDDQLVEVK